MPSIDIYSQIAPSLGRLRLSPEQWGVLLCAYLNLQTGEQFYRPKKTEGRASAAVQSRMLKRLEDRGYIVRFADGPSRRRTSRVALTESGKAWMDKVYAALTTKEGPAE